MNTEQKAFHIGIILAVIVVIISASLQVFNRTQDRARRRTRAEIVRTQQTIAEAQARFSALVRPEILRGIALEMYPDMQAIGFNKTISALEIKQSENTDVRSRN